MPPQPKGRVGGQRQTTHSRKGALTTCLSGETCVRNIADIFYTASGLRAEPQLHLTKRNIEAEWMSGSQNALHIFSQARIKILAPWKYVPLLLARWMEWPRRTLGKSEVLALLTASGRSDQSHRLAPMLWSGPTAETKPLYPMLAGGLWTHSHRTNLILRKWGVWWLKAACLSCLHLNSIVSMTLHLACLEASCASNNNSWCSPSCSREVSCVVRAVDTIDGQLFIDLISKVEGEDGLRASIHQILHWSTTLSTKWNREVEHQAMPQISLKSLLRLRKSKSRHFSHLGESVICDWYPNTIYSVLGVEAWHWTRIDSSLNVLALATQMSDLQLW